MNITVQNYEAHLVRYATYASVSVASVLIAVKLIAWLITDSVSLQATLIDSILDVAASLINMFAVRKAQQPPNNLYRFGHGKAEAIAAVGQSLFITGSAIWLLYEASHRILNPQVITEAGIGVTVMLIAMVLTFFLIVFQRYVVRKTNSAAIRADSMHYYSDFLINGGVILALIGSYWLGQNWLDPVSGAIIGLFILYSAWAIAKEGFYILMDHELPEDIREKIRKIALSHQEVRGVHELRTRSSGLKNFVQLHLELDGEMTLNRTHQVADEVETLVLQEFPQSEIIIHQDPRDLFEAHKARRYE